MTTWQIVFRAESSARVLVTLWLAIAAVLLGWGLWQLARRRWRYAVVCLGSCLGPLVGAPLAGAAVVARYARLGRKGRAACWLVAAAIGAALVAAAAARVSFADAGPGTWMILLGSQVTLAVGIFYSSVYSYLGARRLAALMALRSAAIIVLLLALFRPAISRTFVPIPAAGDKPYLPIVVDRSASMATRDVVGEPPAGEGEKAGRYQHVLKALSPHVEGIEKDFRLVWYHFASTANMADSLESLSRLAPEGPDARHTEMRKALLAVRQDLPTGRTAGVLLLTDGVNTPRRPDPDARELVSAAKRLGAPVYAASVGSPGTRGEPRGKNVRVTSVAVSPPLVMKDNVANVKVAMTVTGFPRSPVRVSLYEGGERNASDSKEAWTHKGHAELTVDLKWTPRQREPAEPVGADIRRLRVAASRQPGETETADNAAAVNVLVTQPRIRLLYVEGSIRPEYKFLKRFLDSDPNVQFASLVRVGDGKFWAYGALAGRKLSGLPTTEQDFRLFDVLIIGDLDRTFLTGGQMRHIRRFVNDGGGLLMLGGHAGLGPGGFGGTDVEQTLPVVVGGRAQPQETAEFVPKLTFVGRRHPVLEGISDYFIGPDGRRPPADVPRLPELLGCVAVVRAKPGADVLLVHPARRNEAGPLVVLAVQPYGVGRAAAFTADTTWRWFMETRALGGESPYERFWGQLVRWLAGADTKSRRAAASVLLQLEPSRTAFRAGEAVVATAAVRPAKADDAAAVTCRLVSADGASKTLDVKPTDVEGRLRVPFKAERPGEYRLEASAADGAGNVVATDHLPVIVMQARDADVDAETAPERLAPDRELLERLAEATGGAHRDVSRLGELIGEIRSRRGGPEGRGLEGPRVMVLPEYGAGTMAALFVVFVGLLTCEWLLRRSWQLH